MQEMLQPPTQPERNGDRRRRLPSRRWSLADGARNSVDGRDDELNVGLVGLGYWGPNILRVLAEQPNVNVRWICDRDPDRLERMSQALSQRHPDRSGTTTCSKTPSSTRS